MPAPLTRAPRLRAGVLAHLNRPACWLMHRAHPAPWVRPLPRLLTRPARWLITTYCRACQRAGIA